mmetsp:Transcript_13498/g.28691  ORF Transcript_13498/g.28691 Transcript_13498/m.28691 type:complete len:81 (-) Transcript_13498:27-269(-)
MPHDRECSKECPLSARLLREEDGRRLPMLHKQTTTADTTAMALANIAEGCEVVIMAEQQPSRPLLADCLSMERKIPNTLY